MVAPTLAPARLSAAGTQPVSALRVSASDGFGDGTASSEFTADCEGASRVGHAMGGAARLGVARLCAT